MDSAGKTVKMEARVTGSQPLSVTWYKGNSEIFSSGKYDVSFKNNMAVLSVRDCTSSDGGEYTCTASNEAGKASCHVSLNISGMSVSVHLHYLKLCVSFCVPLKDKLSFHWALRSMLPGLSWCSCSSGNKTGSLNN